MPMEQNLIYEENVPLLVKITWEITYGGFIMSSFSKVK